MSDAAQIALLVLVALLVGAALPVLVQLFSTLRTVQRTASSIDRKIDDATREVTSLVAAIPHGGRQPDALAAVAGAVAPAVIAAVRAWRAETAEQPRPTTNGAG